MEKQRQYLHPPRLRSRSVYLDNSKHAITDFINLTSTAEDSERRKMMDVTKFIIVYVIIVYLMIAMVAISSVPAFGQSYSGNLSIARDEVALGNKEYSPYLNRTFPDRLLWGGYPPPHCLFD
jgi:hypothetical protein